jgi:hypothetical protein
MEAVRTSETSVDNNFTRQYKPEDSSEHHTRRRENLKSQMVPSCSVCAIFANNSSLVCYWFIVIGWLGGSLFYGAFSVTRLDNVDDMVISTWWYIEKDLLESGRGLNLIYSDVQICLLGCTAV